MQTTESFKDRVAIVGMGCTLYTDRFEDLLFDACYEAFAECHYELTDDPIKETLGSISVKNYANGKLNLKAAVHRGVDMVDMQAYLDAPMISWPRGLDDCCAMLSGAAAAVITRANIASRFRDDYGMAMSVGSNLSTAAHAPASLIQNSRSAARDALRARRVSCSNMY